MLKVLIPVDGSDCSKRATEKLIDMLGSCNEPPRIDLLAVHLPVPRFPNMNVVVSDEMIQRYYDDECADMLAPSKALLDAAGVKYALHTRVGPVAETIVDQATKSGSDMIYIGTRGMTEIGKAMIGSTATKVLHISDIPVLLVK